MGDRQSRSDGMEERRCVVEDAVLELQHAMAGAAFLRDRQRSLGTRTETGKACLAAPHYVLAEPHHFVAQRVGGAEIVQQEHVDMIRAELPQAFVKAARQR